MERIAILVLIAVTVGGAVGVGAFVIRDTQYPAVIEADDATDQLELAIAGLPPIEREEPPRWVREPGADRDRGRRGRPGPGRADAARDLATVPKY